MAAVCQRRHVRLSAWVTGIVLAGWLSVGSPRVPVVASGGTLPTIVVNAGRYGPYYHLRLMLTATMIDFAASDRRARSGGQFELRLRPEHFPIPAPHCRSSLILRMPWTAPTVPDAAAKIAVKQALLARILALEQAPQAVVWVVVELNPYVQVVSRTPLRLQLTQGNVFFRHAFGGYIDSMGPLEAVRGE
jgi:hypothetical protein